MKVAITHGGDTGFIRYDEGSRELMVTHPNEKVRNTVRHYLSHTRTFTVPASNDLRLVGNRVQKDLVPRDNKGNMNIALTEMQFHTGVGVDWGYGGAPEDPTKDPIVDPNAEADKPILKSIDGDDTFEIIN